MQYRCNYQFTAGSDVLGSWTTDHKVAQTLAWQMARTDAIVKVVIFTRFDDRSSWTVFDVITHSMAVYRLGKLELPPEPDRDDEDADDAEAITWATSVSDDDLPNPYAAHQTDGCPFYAMSLQ